MSSSGMPDSGRSVARPVANLGNTCYMNAVLQALVHAPELGLAMDCASHHATCPVYAENAAKLRAASRSSSPDGTTILTSSTTTATLGTTTTVTAATTVPPRKTATRKSRRSGRKSPPERPEQDGAQDFKFCALCEVEEHFRHVHDDSKRDTAVAPTAFVNGFIHEVAPWFKLGVQEDSHEFLRLLIDAMQKSCLQARQAADPTDPNDDGAVDGGGGDKSNSTTVTADKNKTNNPKDAAAEYSFSLFRGTVESNVTCDFCKASSSTLDPIEDIGLEVTMPSAASTAAAAATSTSTTTASRNNSPTPLLADVQSAFQRFARAEALDAGYKCEKCGKVGRATKQSRLANIPPILTLHLKRFRYGDSRAVSDAPPVGRRTGRSEVNQLMGIGADFLTGKSGSAKIEGHVKFEQVVNLKPYLTEELQKKHANMYCRLFAVIVHAGKNSHSGHYIAYVRSLSKNEWWKMDDGRVTHASHGEVMGAEAYMLFYRVVQHPVTLALKEKYKKKCVKAKTVKDESAGSSSSSSRNVAVAVAAESKATEAVLLANRKRLAPDFTNGEDWARAKTNIPPHLMTFITKAQEMVADDIQLTPAFFKLLSDEAAKESAAVGKSPASSICGKLSLRTAGLPASCSARRFC